MDLPRAAHATDRVGVSAPREKQLEVVYLAIEAGEVRGGHASFAGGGTGG